MFATLEESEEGPETEAARRQGCGPPEEEEPSSKRDIDEVIT